MTKKICQKRGVCRNMNRIAIFFLLSIGVLLADSRSAVGAESGRRPSGPRVLT